MIRPLKVEDEQLIQELFRTLSPRSIYFRFFTPLKALSPKMLCSLTHVDHDRDVVLVATQGVAERERILGVFRLMCSPNLKKGELAIVVGDAWQGKGVGAELFQGGLSIAKKRGIDSVWGTALPENTTVLALARKLGFTIRWDGDARAYDLRIDLKSIDRRNDKVSENPE